MVNINSYLPIPEIALKVSKGTRFAPTSGTVRIGRLDVYSTLQDNDVSTVSSEGAKTASKHSTFPPLTSHYDVNKT